MDAGLVISIIILIFVVITFILCLAQKNSAGNNNLLALIQSMAAMQPISAAPMQPTSTAPMRPTSTASTPVAAAVAKTNVIKKIPSAWPPSPSVPQPKPPGMV
jgi:hypothetical protein